MHGADITVVARGPEEVTADRSRPHAPVDGVVDEVRDKGQVDSMVEQVLAEFGKVDVLVNVVGGSWGETFKTRPLMELTQRDLFEAYRVNVVTMFQCSVAVAPLMKKQGKGSIVNIASIAGRSPSPDSPAYGAVKAGVINMKLSMVASWGPDVRVNAIAGIETPHRLRWSDSSAAVYWARPHLGARPLGQVGGAHRHRRVARVRLRRVHHRLGH